MQVKIHVQTFAIIMIHVQLLLQMFVQLII